MKLFFRKDFLDAEEEEDFEMGLRASLLPLLFEEGERAELLGTTA